MALAVPSVPFSQDEIKYNAMKELLLIFIGGGTGSVLRYLVGRCLGSSAWPWGTFAVNIIGCFLIGLIGTWIARHSLSPDLRLLLVVGLCGGFTTFSTFSNEALGLMRSSQLLLALAYIVGSVALGVIAAYVGTKLI